MLIFLLLKFQYLDLQFLQVSSLNNLFSYLFIVIVMETFFLKVFNKLTLDCFFQRFKSDIFKWWITVFFLQLLWFFSPKCALYDFISSFNKHPLEKTIYLSSVDLDKIIFEKFFWFFCQHSFDMIGQLRIILCTLGGQGTILFVLRIKVLIFFLIVGTFTKSLPNVVEDSC